MTGTAVALREPQNVTLTNDQLTYIANTEFVNRSLRGNMPAILACVATGRSIGIADMDALRLIDMIEGQASMSAELMVLLARRQHHSITSVEPVTDRKAHLKGRRADNGDEMEVIWTIEMAERAGLLGKSNWKKYPEAMLWARAASQLCRMLFPDCFAGAAYTPEELGDEDSAGADSLEAHDPAAAPAGDDWDSNVIRATVADADNAAEERGKKPATEAQKKKLDVLVKGTVKPELRRVYKTVALHRVRSTDELILDVGGMDGDGLLHWSPLRDSLTRAEAHDLIDRLEKLEPQA